MPGPIGLIGTVTSDVITYESGERYEGIGGILYQAAVLCALGKPVLLFSHLGRELKPDVDSITATWESFDRRGVQLVPGPGNRVFLHYPLQGERVEILKSVVPPIQKSQILPHISSLGFLVMVLNSGFDIGLEDWRAAVRFTHCPVWLDIHSLILSKKLDKPRHYVSFVEWREWAAGVEYLQANRAEVASLLGFPDENPEEEDLKRFGRQAIEAGVRTVFVTLGEEGILVFTPEGSEIISPSEQGHIVDTTGCGDVFCGGAVAKLAEGKDPYQAAQFAVDLATQAASVVGIPATYRSIQQKSP